MKKVKSIVLNILEKCTFPVVIFTMWTELSFEPVRARDESDVIAKHVNPSV